MFNNSRGGGYSSSSKDEEEPLLDELGIHPEQIWSKTRSILNPFRTNRTVHEDSSDLSGPIFLYLALCLFQLFAGKIQFGVILGWIVASSVFLYAVFNMLAGRRSGNLGLHTCTSLVGYCLLPLVVFSAVSLLFVPREGDGVVVVRFVVAGVFVLWSSRACSGLVVSLADGGEEHRGLISYACFLIYCLFSLLVVF
ncbi:Integral membrane Yip1 family protein [Raphanus sativus]|nr:Integral membrane Yip1 family protein [Raphanus sativus]